MMTTVSLTGLGDDMLCRQLHDKSTRGDALTDGEETQLKAWYKQKDAEENSLLMSTPSRTTALSGLQSEVESTLSRLLTATQHIQTLTDQNEALRREVATLHEQLGRKGSLQAA